MPLNTEEITENISIHLTENGSVKQIKSDSIMINQLIGNEVDGSLQNIYLRFFYEDNISAYPLIGPSSNSVYIKTDQGGKWTGTIQNVSYEVYLYISFSTWFWDIKLEGEERNIDLLYGQDIALAEEAAVRTNEAYVSQYIDHSSRWNDQFGWTICSRQNQPQEGKHPFLQQGCFNRADGYATDGFQFFGLSYKKTNVPEILTQPYLPNKVYQYEFAYPALQTEKVQLSGTHNIVFYSMFKKDHAQAVEEAFPVEDILKEWKQLPYANELNLGKGPLESSIEIPYTGLEWSEKDIDYFFPERILEEKEKGEILSFFTNSYEHVVLPLKEIQMERPHGHILLTQVDPFSLSKTMTTNCYMYGVFNAQVSLGNANFNKLMSSVRNPLNIMKTSGQRIYVEKEGKYRLLTMPSAFEMGFNYAKWYYKTEDDVLIITNFSASDQSSLHLQFTSLKQKKYKFLVTSQLTMQNNEYEVSYHKQYEENKVAITAGTKADSQDVYPHLTYNMHVSGTDFYEPETSLFQVESGLSEWPLLEWVFEETKEWTIDIEASFDTVKPASATKTFQEEKEKYRSSIQSFMKNFHLSIKEKVEELDRINATAWWYTHNMLVHYAVPHGLEQYGGAAWGTRDVCQGPLEFFLASQQYEISQSIIKTVFSHQYEQDGSWPQWFMFDRYEKIQQPESHGDIILWPLKAVCDYIEASNDFTILHESVPYMNKDNLTFTAKRETIMEHLLKEIDYIEKHFIKGTYLSEYDDGDWDDTLQPYDPSLKKYLVSSWTVALTYETINKISKIFKEIHSDIAVHLKQTAENIKKDFNEYLLQDNITTGFLYLKDMKNPLHMLHPNDKETGISYRLLPMQQGVISELFNKRQADTHYSIIKKHLHFPDGVRLMNKPAPYSGGVSTRFKRAEQAANFGREIGLQYVHAHIRYVEALAKLGKYEEAWEELKVVTPVRIQDSVKHALKRQANAYFSSSDGDFSSRYEAKEKFLQLKDGTTSVKGGWRIYSSGPGIFMNQLITNVLGIRMSYENLIIDPILPLHVTELAFEFTCFGKPATFIYHLNASISKIVVNNKEIKGSIYENAYRKGGIVLNKQEIDKEMRTVDNVIDVYIKQ